MKSSRNLWPYGILLAFVLFISGTAALIAIACRNDSDLVSTDYYEEELQYQSQIDGFARARELESEAGIVYDAAQRRIVVQLPASHAAREAQGQIQLYRPSAAGLDRIVPLNPDANGAQVLDATSLPAGLWKVKLHWTVGGREYRLDRKLVLTTAPS